MSETADHLQDAEPDAGRPGPSPERLRYDAASQKRDGIGKRMREWTGARSGAAYDALVADWKGAQAESDKAFDALIDAQASNQGGDQP